MLTLLMLLLPPTHVAANPSLVKKGSLDLQGRSLDEPINLTGEWEFHWGKLLAPSEMEPLQEHQVFMRVPGLWSQENKRFPSLGYATYRLRVLLDNAERMAFYIPTATLWSSSRIYVDGVEVAMFGKVGTHAGESRGGIGTKLYEFTPKSASFDIIIQVSNFEFFLCGISAAPMIGSHDVLQTIRERAIGIDLCIVGALLIMGIYHLCLYFLRTEDRSTFFFGLTCIAIGVHISTTRAATLSLFAPDASFDTMVRIYNLSWQGGAAFIAWFGYYAFRPLYSRWMPWIMSSVAFGFCVFILTNEARVFVNPTVLFLLLTVIMFFYSLWTVVRACLLRIEGAWLFLGGVALITVTGINDMLALRHIIQTPALIGLGILGFILLQSYMIAFRFSGAFRRVKISEMEIRDLSKDLHIQHQQVIELNSNLEHLVDEKTRDIRSMMEHLPLLVFMIASDRKIHKDCSRQVRDLFKGLDIESLDAGELIFQGSSLSFDERSQAMSCLNSVIGDDPINFDVNSHTLPSEMRREVPDRGQRNFELTWNIIENADGITDKILVTMRDVTDIRTLQEHAKGQQEELQIIGEILSVPVPRFIRFMQSCQDLIAENNQLIHSQAAQRYNGEVLKLLFINMHTIKGAARSLFFKRMTDVFHHIEQYYASLQKDSKADWDLVRMKNELQEATLIVNTYERIAREKLGRNTDQIRTVDFPLTQIETSFFKLDHVTRSCSLPPPAASVIADIKSLFHLKLYKDAQAFFEDLLSCLPLLARDLQKDLPDVHLETGGYLLSEKAEVLLSKILIHILRNSMDHGIETVSERIKAGKSRQGHLDIRLERQENAMLIIYSDDGRGLNLRKIREIGVARNLTPADLPMDPQTVADLIFDSGLSTANHVTDISGRGVGMGAVRRFVQQIGGQVRIVLQPDNHVSEDFRNFQFVFELPFDLFAEPLTSVNTETSFAS